MNDMDERLKKLEERIAALEEATKFDPVKVRSAIERTIAKELPKFLSSGMREARVSKEPGDREKC